MRIVVVSAHFPPNFVSGGTVQPQRLARGLRALGHEVWVYAGWLGAARPPLSTWSETDETGLPVRWIVTTPFTDWADPRNFDNPAVTADFSAFLAAVRPEVVHVHSLQSLGAGVVTAAADFGARVAVTMHDFWWWCGRQFLADRDLVPCSLAVDCGVCQCHVDRAWLDARDAVLARTLTRVDLVLAPSASAAAVFVSNGLDPALVIVDENGIESPPPGALTPRPGAGGPVTLLYAGGSEELKGIAVLAAALRRLVAEAPGGWQVLAYGAGQWAAEHPGGFGRAPVEVLPPFEPEGAAAIFAGAAALVLPSIMRESHSLLTREALQAGVPVVCSDCIGPEEVVEDGRNGLVVPTGDVGALAAALRQVVMGATFDTDPPPRLRPLADQVQALEQRLASLVPRPPGGPRVRRVFFVVGIDGAPLRYRVRLPVEAIAPLGVESTVAYYTDPDLATLAVGADVVVVYRCPATPALLAFVRATQARGVPVAFDADDLIFDPSLAGIPALGLLAPAEAGRWLEGVQRYRTTLEACDAFIGSTPALVRAAAALTGLPSEVFDNGVGRVLARWSDVAVRQDRTPGPWRVGYFSGTITHDRDWQMIESAVLEGLSHHPEAELWLVGHVPVSDAASSALGPRLRRIPFTPWIELPRLLRDVDVNLAPLEAANPFNEAKSHVKWLEAALVATPTIASPTEPFAAAIADGRNGVLAAEPDAWADAVDRLLTDGLARTRLGHRARRDTLLGWPPARQGRRYAELLDRVLDRGVGVRTSEWAPVVVDEAARHQPLEPYASLDPAMRHPSRLRARARHLLHRLGLASEPSAPAHH